MQRADEALADLPWALRDPAEAEALLQAAVSGGMPQRRVERLALLHLLMRLHRDAHLRSGARPWPGTRAENPESLVSDFSLLIS
jgi:hypothetical protein